MESIGKSQVEEKFEIIFSNCLLVAVLQATLAVCRGISLKIKFSNCLLVAILQALLAVCRGIKMRLTPSLGYDNIV